MPVLSEKHPSKRKPEIVFRERTVPVSRILNFQNILIRTRIEHIQRYNRIFCRRYPILLQGLFDIGNFC
jgi:hypothetical protein